MESTLEALLHEAIFPATCFAMMTRAFFRCETGCEDRGIFYTCNFYRNLFHNAVALQVVGVTSCTAS